MKKILLVLFCCLLGFASCKQKGQTEILTVASERGNCTGGVMKQKCLIIKEQGDAVWEFWYSEIIGFDYEPGFEYELEVRREIIENPAADQGRFNFVLVKVISKTQKQSVNLPFIPDIPSDIQIPQD